MWSDKNNKNPAQAGTTAGACDAHSRADTQTLILCPCVRRRFIITIIILIIILILIITIIIIIIIMIMIITTK